jgi:hypothetical protein
MLDMRFVLQRPGLIFFGDNREQFAMGVVITRNGHLVLFIHESLFGPGLFVEERMKFFEVFFAGVDIDIIVEDVL